MYYRFLVLDMGTRWNEIGQKQLHSRKEFGRIWKKIQKRNNTFEMVHILRQGVKGLKMCFFML